MPGYKLLLLDLKEDLPLALMQNKRKSDLAVFNSAVFITTERMFSLTKIRILKSSY